MQKDLWPDVSAVMPKLYAGRQNKPSKIKFKQ